MSLFRGVNNRCRCWPGNKLYFDHNCFCVQSHDSSCPLVHNVSYILEFFQNSSLNPHVRSWAFVYWSVFRYTCNVITYCSFYISIGIYYLVMRLASWPLTITSIVYCHQSTLCTLISDKVYTEHLQWMVIGDSQEIRDVTAQCHMSYMEAYIYPRSPTRGHYSLLFNNRKYLNKSTLLALSVYVI